MVVSIWVIVSCHRFHPVEAVESPQSAHQGGMWKSLIPGLKDVPHVSNTPARAACCSSDLKDREEHSLVIGVSTYIMCKKQRSDPGTIVLHARPVDISPGISASMGAFVAFMLV